MANLTALRTSVRRLIGEEDVNDTHFTTEEIDAYINEAVLFLGVEMEWPLQTSTAVGVQEQALYSLPTDFVSLVDVYYDDRKLVSVDRDDLSALNAAWQDAPPGTPKYVYKADNFVIGLWPEPSAEEAEKLIQIQYIQVPAVLSASDSIPDLHQAYHLCLPYYAAAKCEAKVENDKKAKSNMDLFELHRRMLMARVQRFDGGSMRWKFVG